MLCVRIERGNSGASWLLEASLAKAGLQEDQGASPLLVVGDQALTKVSGGLYTSAAQWRGSMLYTASGEPYVPVLDPADIVKGQWHLKKTLVRDMRRLAMPWEAPSYQDDLSPSPATIRQWLDAKVPLTLDIETRGGHITCIGLARSPIEALVVPFVLDGQPYWDAPQEREIVRWLCEWMHEYPELVWGQNFRYDAFYMTWRWGVRPRWGFDTLVAQHVLFPGEPKDLAHLASLYARHYVYWKDDRDGSDEALWAYNAQDVRYTFEIAQRQQELLRVAELESQFTEQMAIAHMALDMELRGLRVDKSQRKALTKQVSAHIEARTQAIEGFVGHSLNTGSNKQMLAYFVGERGVKGLKRTKKGGTSLGDASLEGVAKRYPELAGLCHTILEKRSLGSALSTVLKAELCEDGRLRTSFNTCGTETYRWSSSKNALGSGMNVQNITKGGQGASGLELPNLRTLIVPDPGWTLLDMDLHRADLQVVVWESGEPAWRALMRTGVDAHTESAKVLFGVASPTEEQRQFAKGFAHATNYLASPRTCAIQFGVPVAKATEVQALWFKAHPGIKEWHARVKSMLKSKGYVTNVWGYRKFFYGDADSVLKEAVAWIPQSTVAILINRTILHLQSLYSTECFQPLAQVHDSLLAQFRDLDPTEVQTNACLEVPYGDPLVIGVGCKTSTRSWGELA